MRVSTDDLFHVLDGRHLAISANQWCLEVYAVIEHEGVLWIQLLLRGAPDYSVTVRMFPDESGQDTLDALSQWLSEPSRLNTRVRLADS